MDPQLVLPLPLVLDEEELLANRVGGCVGGDEEAVDDREKAKSGRGPPMPPESRLRMLTRSAAAVRGCAAPPSRGEIEPVVEEDADLVENTGSGFGNWTDEVWMGGLAGSASMLHLRRLGARISSSSAGVLNARGFTAAGRDTGEIGMGVWPSCFTDGEIGASCSSAPSGRRWVCCCCGVSSSISTHSTTNSSGSASAAPSVQLGPQRRSPTGGLTEGWFVDVGEAVIVFLRRTRTLRLRATRTVRWRSRSSTVIHESPHGRSRFSVPILELDLPLDEGVAEAREVSEVDKSSLVGLSAVILPMVGLSDRWGLREDAPTKGCGAGVAI